jgi:hypothetical protein
MKMRKKRVDLNELALAIAGKKIIVSQGDAVPLHLNKEELAAYEAAVKNGYLMTRHGRRPNLSNAVKYYCGATFSPFIKAVELYGPDYAGSHRIYYDLMWADSSLTVYDSRRVLRLFDDYGIDGDRVINPIWGGIRVKSEHAETVARELLSICRHSINSGSGLRA